ncbi:MAG: hypothetical protein M3081_15125 [Gemmatimonadota bacterium]|nr:hypothetical protein [Gemmatimonadota bacterium]
MTLSSRAVRALCLLPLFGVSATVAAQAPAASSLNPQMRLASALEGDSRDATVSRSAATILIDHEAYVLAYRRAARVACRIGLPNALDGALKDARAGLGTLPDNEKGEVNHALDSAFSKLQHDGGCSLLIDATKIIVVDGVEGFSWNTPFSRVARRGNYTDEGFLVAERDVKMAGVKGSVSMTFTALKGSEKLISGRYHFAVAADKCDEQWNAIEREVLARYPSLRSLRTKAAASCAVSETANWSTSFRNPDTDALEISMVLRHGYDGQTYILLEFPGLPGFAQR